MEGAGRNSLTTFSKLRLTLSRFSRNARLFHTFLVQNSGNEFHENRTDGLVSNTE